MKYKDTLICLVGHALAFGLSSGFFIMSSMTKEPIYWMLLPMAGALLGAVACSARLYTLRKANKDQTKPVRPTLEETLPSLKPTQIFEYCDFPRIFITEYVNGDRYLNLSVWDSKGTSLFLCKRLSILDFTLMNIRKLPLRDWLLDEKDPVFLITSESNMPSKAERIRYSDLRNEWLPEQGAFLVEEYENKTPVEVKVKKDREPTHYTETVPVTYAQGTVFVCSLRDIECGTREANWCIKCPMRGLVK